MGTPQLRPLQNAALKAWLARIMPNSPRYHPGKAQKIATRWPIVHDTLDEIAKAKSRHHYWTGA